MPSDWYAFAALSDARDATEGLLRPVDRGRWLRLALIALFVGVGGGAPTGGNFNVPSGGGGGGGGGGPPPDFSALSMPDPGSIAAIVLGILVLIVLLSLVWSAIGAVMEFVLIAGLRDRDVSIRAPFREEFWPGMRLFGFRLLVGLGSLLVLGLPLIAVFGLGISVSPALLVLLVPLMILFGIAALVSSIVLGLTTDFVVPTMLTEDRGVLDSWRRLWPTLRAEWKQTALYVVAKFVLGIAVSLAVSLVVLLAALIVAIPFALVGGALFFATSAAGAHTVGWVLVGILVALYVLVLIVVGLIVQVPALTFVRYYSLSVLGMLVPELDLVGVDRPEEDGEDGDVTDDEDGGDGPDAGEGGIDDGDDGPSDGTSPGDDSPAPTGTAGTRPVV